MPVQATTEDATVPTDTYYDGGRAGWSVAVACDCEVVPLGPVKTLKGILATRRAGPVVIDGALRATAPGGQGVYRQRFAPALDDPAAADGTVTITFLDTTALAASIRPL